MLETVVTGSSGSRPWRTLILLLAWSIGHTGLCETPNTNPTAPNLASLQDKPNLPLVIKPMEDGMCVFAKVPEEPVDNLDLPNQIVRTPATPQALLKECEKLEAEGKQCNGIVLTGHAGQASAGVGSLLWCDKAYKNIPTQFFPNINASDESLPFGNLFDEIVACFKRINRPGRELVFNSCGGVIGQATCLWELAQMFQMPVTGITGACWGNVNDPKAPLLRADGKATWLTIDPDSARPSETLTDAECVMELQLVKHRLASSPEQEITFVSFVKHISSKCPEGKECKYRDAYGGIPVIGISGPSGQPANLPFLHGYQCVGRSPY